MSIANWREGKIGDKMARGPSSTVARLRRSREAIGSLETFQRAESVKFGGLESGEEAYNVDE